MGRKVRQRYEKWKVTETISSVLVSDDPSGNSELVVIDWELARLGHPSYDLGQMIGDLLERNIMNNAESALWIIEGFIEGYGELSEELAFRTAIYAGIHLICWYIRGSPQETQERTENILRIGMDFVLRGWEGDREWFKNSILAGLFSRASALGSC